MAFIGLLGVMVTALVIVLFLGVAPIIIGSVLIKRTERKRLGIFFKILGYFILIPTIIITIILVIIMKIGVV